MSLFSKKKLLFAALAFSFAGIIYAVFIPSVGVDQDKARASFQKGLQLHSNYSYSASIDYFMESLSYDSEFSLARRMLGQSLYFSGQVDEALNEWKFLFDSDSYDPSLQLHMQSLRSFHVVPEPAWRFLKKVKQQRGYRFTFPVFIATLPDRNHMILISRTGFNTSGLMFINSNGVFIDNIRKISGKLEMPIAAAMSAKQLWVTDMKADKIHRLEVDYSKSKQGDTESLDELGKSGSGDLEFHGPAGICFNGEYFFIADQGNNRIQKILPDGSFIQHINGINAENPIRQPFGVACDKESLFVSESESGRILQFDLYGNFVAELFEGQMTRPRHLSLTDKYLIATDEKEGVFILDRKKNTTIRITGYTSDDLEKKKFLRPYAATVDSFGNLFVSDYGAHEIIQLVPEQFLYSNLEVWVERIYSDNFPSIGVWVSVKDQLGQFVTDLDADNFKVFENDADVGKVGTTYLDQFKDSTRWVVLQSKSKSMKKYRDTSRWLSDFFLKELYNTDKVKVVSYSDSVRSDSEWTNSRLRTHQALDMVSDSDFQTDKVAALGKSVYTSITELLPEKGKRAIIWITDANIKTESMVDFSFARLENYARNNHIPIFILCYENPDIVGWKDNIGRLKEFSKKTGGRYYSVYKDDLGTLAKKLKELPEERYVLSFKSQGDKAWTNQYMEIKVRVKFQGRNGMETSGFFIK